MESTFSKSCLVQLHCTTPFYSFAGEFDFAAYSHSHIGLPMDELQRLGFHFPRRRGCRFQHLEVISLIFKRFANIHY